MYHINDLTCPPIVGETYLVDSYECCDERIFGSKYLPVLGPIHNDTPDTDDTSLHNSHIDHRFLPYGDLDKYARLRVFFKDARLMALVIKVRWQSDAKEDAKEDTKRLTAIMDTFKGHKEFVDVDSYAPRPFVCVAETMASISKSGEHHKLTVLERLGGKPIRFNCRTCPHHGTHLGSIPYTDRVIDGVVVRGKSCPAHGLFVHKHGVLEK